jgi:hypothetical protein
MRKRLAVVAAALTAIVGVAAGSGMAADQQRLQDGTGDGVPDLIQDQTHLQLHDGSCK